MLFTVAIASAVSAKSAVAELSAEFATTISCLPSPLKSATATAVEPVSAAGLGAAVKVPSPLPSKIDTLLLPALATARSATPSPLKSATATEVGAIPVAGLATAVNVPSPLPSKIDTLLLPEFVTAKSRRPSPLKSATAMDVGLSPVAGLAAVALKFPVPSPNRIVRLGFVTARSRRPSPLKSPTAIAADGTEDGGGTNPNSEPAVKVPSPLPSTVRNALLGIPEA